MAEPLEVTYFNWLCAKVRKVSFPLYYDLLKMLFETEFVWLLEGDHNRAEDGLELREYFDNDTGLGMCPEWDHTPCSVLEMLIALSDRAYLQTDISIADWFWVMIQNLGLDEYRQVQASDRPVISKTLYDFVWRLYEDNGQRGIFPMRWPKQDQRSVEIWYQFCDYVEEKQLA